MAVAENVTIIDGQTYNPGDTLAKFIRNGKEAGN